MKDSPYNLDLRFYKDTHLLNKHGPPPDSNALTKSFIQNLVLNFLIINERVLILKWLKGNIGTRRMAAERELKFNLPHWDFTKRKEMNRKIGLQY